MLRFSHLGVKVFPLSHSGVEAMHSQLPPELVSLIAIMRGNIELIPLTNIRSQPKPSSHGTPIAWEGTLTAIY